MVGSLTLSPVTAAVNSIDPDAILNQDASGFS
jgi:hypothetical protein